eukprot:CAMPEP_0195083784 /NCGR_PEP_ID=MMETSP0448-20130528/24633_1 /TAXON_ID=66468 /ORGANISM="Heterocapsa triquestra, Strain CCMP 448" /LENGTH=163 /DNA_ID=CAMNT_0040117027 /DNA_START=271 /DNA_END=760 /DNA_ORIENTATION=+
MNDERDASRFAPAAKKAKKNLLAPRNSSLKDGFVSVQLCAGSLLPSLNAPSCMTGKPASGRSAQERGRRARHAFGAKRTNYTFGARGSAWVRLLSRPQTTCGAQALLRGAARALHSAPPPPAAMQSATVWTSHATDSAQPGQLNRPWSNFPVHPKDRSISGRL